MSKFTSVKRINTRWRNNDFIGEPGSSHTFADALHEEFLVDWAYQIQIGDIIITETPTTGNIQMSTLTVGDIVLTGTATGNFGGGGPATIVQGTAPISISTNSNTSTVSIDQTAITAAAATSSLNTRTLVRNVTASTIAKGSVVYLASSNGTVPTIEKALATTDATSSRTFGIVQDDITANSTGYVINQGVIDPVDTSGIANGAVLWLSTSIAGAYTTTKPAGPNHGVLVGVCVKGGSVGNGSIYVFIKNGAELDEIHDVNISGLTNGQALIWSSAQSVWINQSINTAIASISGTSPIVASTDTASMATTISVSTGTTASTVATGNHTHTGFATLTGTETLTNKTLTLPVIDNPKIGTISASITGTTILTSSSSYYQLYTTVAFGSVVQLPDVATMSVGQSFEFINNGGNYFNLITSSGLSLGVTVYPTSASYRVTCISTASNAASSWLLRIIPKQITGISTAGSVVFDSNPVITNPTLTGVTVSGATVNSITNITSAGTTTVISGTSLTIQRVTGTANQTLTLSTATAGRTIIVESATTGDVTVRSSGLENIVVIKPNQAYVFIQNTSNGTTAATWDAYLLQGRNQSILLSSSALTITTTTQPASPTTANTQAISWTSATKANTSMWSSGSSITLPNAGLYSYTVGSRFGTGTGYNVGLYAFQGSTLRHHITKDASSTGSLDNIEMNGMISAAANDTLAIYVAATAASKSLSANTFLGVTWLGDL